jgi:polyisoprenoid-binding protein YceI
MKNLKQLIAVFLFFAALPVFAQNNWVFDDAHSNLQFTIKHLMVSEIEGSFKVKEATLVSQGNDFSNASVHVVADVGSVDTNNDGRDDHLRKPDFFDAEKYPDMVFKSHSFKKVSDTNYQVTGDLTFHGITKSVVLDATAGTNVNPYDNKPLVGFKVRGTINRTDYGISKDTPSALLSDEVEIRGNFIFVKG